VISVNFVYYLEDHKYKHAGEVMWLVAMLCHVYEKEMADSWRAIETYEDAIDDNVLPDDPTYFWGLLAEVFRRDGVYDRAIQACEIIVEMEPDKGCHRERLEIMKAEQHNRPANPKLDCWGRPPDLDRRELWQKDHGVRKASVQFRSWLPVRTAYENSKHRRDFQHG
jgi:hypothetical protein